MNFGLDWDGSVTEDPSLFLMFAKLARASGRNTFIATVKIREEHNGRPVKKEVVELIDGKDFAFQSMWVMENNDPYPGEQALFIVSNADGSENLAAATLPIWIASGDVTNIRMHKPS